MREISIEKATSMVLKRNDDKTIIRLPYKMQIKDDNGKIEKTNKISLKFLFNAIRLTNLKHPETEDCLESIDIQSIDACYIFGSIVKPRYEKISSSLL